MQTIRIWTRLPSYHHSILCHRIRKNICRLRTRCKTRRPTTESPIPPLRRQIISKLMILARPNNPILCAILLLLRCKILIMSWLTFKKITRRLRSWRESISRRSIQNSSNGMLCIKLIRFLARDNIPWGRRLMTGRRQAWSTEAWYRAGPSRRLWTSSSRLIRKLIWICSIPSLGDPIQTKACEHRTSKMNLRRNRICSWWVDRNSPLIFKLREWMSMIMRTSLLIRRWPSRREGPGRAAKLNRISYRMQELPQWWSVPINAHFYKRVTKRITAMSRNCTNWERRSGSSKGNVRSRLKEELRMQGRLEVIQALSFRLIPLSKPTATQGSQNIWTKLIHLRRRQRVQHQIQNIRAPSPI